MKMKTNALVITIGCQNMNNNSEIQRQRRISEQHRLYIYRDNMDILYGLEIKSLILCIRRS